MKSKIKKKTQHSVVANLYYILKLMFSISPMLVIGEIAVEVISVLPGRMVSVVGIKYIIDKVQAGEGIADIAFAIVLIVILLVLEAVIRPIFSDLFSAKEREKLYLDLHGKLYEKAKSLDLEKYDDSSFYSDFILAVETSSENIEYIVDRVKDYISEIISFIAVSSVILTIDPICLIIVLAFVLVFMPVGRYIGNVQMKRREIITDQHRKGDYFARLFYLPDYVGEIRMNSLTSLLINRFKNSADDIKKTQAYYIKKIDTAFFLQASVVETIGFMLVLVGYIGYRTIVTKSMSAGDFIATINGAVNIGNSVMYLTVFAVRNFTEQSKMIEKYRTFLSCDVNIKDGAHTAECGDPEEIELKNVSFTYPGNSEPTLKNINMVFKPKEKIALVGYNGAGKTTLTNLLLRLYDAESGEILIGGRNIKDETVNSHRDRFAAVFQDFKIFGATVAENVAMDKTVDNERVLDAISAAGFKKDLPNGADTVLLREFSDDGLMLSGGEEQKLTIARAFYKKCPYVIFDEPSANLDPISEYEFNRAMCEAAADKTVIFISHRLSTTMHADKIFMLENGSVTESGSHEELMALNGKYAYMFKLQSDKYIAEPH